MDDMTQLTPMDPERGREPAPAPTAAPQAAATAQSTPAPEMTPGPPPREVEAKFAVAERSAVQDLIQLTRLGDDYVLGRGKLVEITDTYYDTLDYALLRVGFTLRVRQIDDDTKLTVKALQRTGYGPVHSRMEIEGSLPPQAPPLDPLSWPPQIRQTVEEITGSSPVLAPVVMLEQSRHLRPVYRAAGNAAPPTAGTAAPTTALSGSPTTAAAAAPTAEPTGSPIGELSVERVTVLDPDRAGVRHGALELVARFAEMEFELSGEGNEADMKAVVDVLEARDDLKGVGESKFERALTLSAVHPPGHGVGVFGIQPNMSMPEAGRLTWRRQLAAMLLNEAGARRGDDIEYVHDMRVATRRGRAAARVFGKRFQKPLLRRYMRALGATTRALGPVRDLDVALDKLAKGGAGASKGLSEHDEALADEWRAHRVEAYEQLLEWLDSDEYRRFIADFSLFCASPGHGVRVDDDSNSAKIKPSPTQVRHVMPVEVLRRFEAVRSYETLFEQGAVAPPPVEALHALRIDCKGLRYGLEFVSRILGEDGATLIEQLKDVQDHLGDLNDAVVARDKLLAMRAAGVAAQAANAVQVGRAAGPAATSGSGAAGSKNRDDAKGGRDSGKSGDGAAKGGHDRGASGGESAKSGGGTGKGGGGGGKGGVKVGETGKSAATAGTSVAVGTTGGGEGTSGGAAQPRSGAAIENQLALQEATIEELRAGVSTVLAEFVSPDNRQLLMRALARL